MGYAVANKKPRKGIAVPGLLRCAAVFIGPGAWSLAMETARQFVAPWGVQ